MDVELVAPAAPGRGASGDTALPRSAVVPRRARPSQDADGPSPEKTAQAVTDVVAPAGVAARVDPSASEAYATIDPAAGEEYRRVLLDHILIYRRSPGRTGGADRAGTVMVHFSVTRGGDVQALMIAASSGDPDLDDEAVATIWRARPMPPIPPVLPDRVSVTLPVTFRVQVPG